MTATLCLSLLAGCGGGDDPPAPEKLEMAFYGQGVLIGVPGIDELGQSRLITSSDEYAAIPPARFPQTLPAGFKEPDYTKNYLLYLDHKPFHADEWTAYLAIERIESDANAKKHVVFAEYCLVSHDDAFGTNPLVRSYAFYATNRIEGTVEVRWTERIDPNCVAYKPTGG